MTAAKRIEPHWVLIVLFSVLTSSAFAAWPSATHPTPSLIAATAPTVLAEVAGPPTPAAFLARPGDSAPATAATLDVEGDAEPFSDPRQTAQPIAPSESEFAASPAAAPAATEPATTAPVIAEPESVPVVAEPAAPTHAYYVINAPYGDSQADVDAGTVNWCGTNWFIAHSNTLDGIHIASLCPGDVVCANGVEYTIEGSAYCHWGESADIYLSRYAGRALFSTCADDSGTAYLFYSTLY